LIIRSLNFVNIILPSVPADALSAAPGIRECLRVQFRVKTLGPPAGQSVRIHLGQQHAALSHRTLAETAQLVHCLSTTKIHDQPAPLLNSVLSLTRSSRTVSVRGERRGGNRGRGEEKIASHSNTIRLALCSLLEGWYILLFSFHLARIAASEFSRFSFPASASMYIFFPFR